LKQCLFSEKGTQFKKRAILLDEKASKNQEFLDALTSGYSIHWAEIKIISLYWSSYSQG
jgi:hypothetical protein